MLKDRLNFFKEILKYTPISKKEKEKMVKIANIRIELALYIYRHKKLAAEEIDTLLMWYSALVRDIHTEQNYKPDVEKLYEYVDLYKDRK